MAKKLWQKNLTPLHPLVEKYTVSEDCIWDEKILLYDIEASIAHAAGLLHINVINKQEYDALANGLAKLKKEYLAGKIKLTLADEDCHTLIESYLIKQVGVAGKKIHAGRSRNDQILVALRLLMKQEARLIVELTKKLAEKFLSQAKKYQDIPLPGHTHNQQAMLSIVGHYLSAWAEQLGDDAKLTAELGKHINKNPLGSAAGLGVSFPLDRDYTGKLMGFDETQINSLYCQNTRGKFEGVFLEGLTQIMITLSKFAGDMIFFTAREVGYFSFPDNFTTGSSIMPQKKNLDALELMRAFANVVMANQEIVKNINKNTISGYSRDYQLTKKPLLESIEIVKNSLAVAELFVAHIKPNSQTIADKIAPDIFAADIANELVEKKHLPFRDAYEKALKLVGKQKIDYQKIIKNRKSLGAPGNLGLDRIAKKIK